MYLKKLNYRVDITKLLPYLENIDWDDRDRCSINEPIGDLLYGPYRIKSDWKGTEFEKVLSSLPFPVGEARLMRLSPGEVYRSHADIDDRYHLNLLTNEHCYLIDLDNKEMHQLFSDNELYLMDGSYLHTAVNFGSSHRVQLVIRVPLKQYKLDNFLHVDIMFLNPPHNLRYVVDQEISSYLNRSVKANKLGYFKEITPVHYTMSIDKESLAYICNKLDHLKVEYIVKELENDQRN